MSRAWRKGSTRKWRKLREFVLARDRYLCQVPDEHGRICGRHAHHAGHIIPKAEGGTDTPHNLRAECSKHNLSDGGRIAHRFRAVPRRWTW